MTASPEPAQALPPAARQLIERHFGATAQEATFAPVAGTTNFVACVRIGTERFALRAPRLPDAVTLVDRASERCILEQVARAGIGPQIVAVDEAGGVLLTRWIEGSVWSVEHAREREGLVAMAQLLRALHALPVPRVARRLRLEELIETYLAGLAPGHAVSEAHAPARQEVEACRALHAEASRRLRRLPRSKRTLCHNDAHHRNVIQSGSRLWLLDWEYAAEGEALFDLAGYASQNGLDERQAALFLESYGAGAAAREAFADWRWVFDYVSLLWLAGALLSDPSSLRDAPIATGPLLARLTGERMIGHP